MSTHDPHSPPSLLPDGLGNEPEPHEALGVEAGSNSVPAIRFEKLLEGCNGPLGECRLDGIPLEPPSPPAERALRRNHSGLPGERRRQPSSWSPSRVPSSCPAPAPPPPSLRAWAHHNNRGDTWLVAVLSVPLPGPTPLPASPFPLARPFGVSGSDSPPLHATQPRSNFNLEGLGRRKPMQPQNRPQALTRGASLSSPGPTTDPDRLTPPGERDDHDWWAEGPLPGAGSSERSAGVEPSQVESLWGHQGVSDLSQTSVLSRFGGRSLPQLRCSGLTGSDGPSWRCTMCGLQSTTARKGQLKVRAAGWIVSHVSC
jgi:hypothetical protein